MQKLIIAATAGAFALCVTTASGALAASSTTTTTFAVTGGALSITAPTTATLSDAGTGGSSTGSLGPVTVTDARALLTGSWTASVDSTDFSSVSGAPTIPKANVMYASGPATTWSGTVVPTPGQPVNATPVSLGSTQTAFSAALEVGNSSATWNPTITVTVPSTAVAGTYTGTITHSVA